MRDQYASDLSDYIKFSLLRALASEDRNLGIAWYYVPCHDGRNDGRHLEWQKDRAWRALDPALFDSLCNLPERSVSALEVLKIWPKGTIFHREPVSSRLQRAQWTTQMRAKLANGNLIFLDPDNGLGEHATKHATYEEVRDFRAPQRTVVFIKFPGRIKREAQVRELHDRLKAETGTKRVFTVHTNVSVPRIDDPRFVIQRERWFTIIDADASLLGRARNFTAILSSLPRAKCTLTE